MMLLRTRPGSRTPRTPQSECSGFAIFAQPGVRLGEGQACRIGRVLPLPRVPASARVSGGCGLRRRAMLPDRERGEGRIRTDNILFAGQALYQLELHPHGAGDADRTRYLLRTKQAHYLQCFTGMEPTARIELAPAAYKAAARPSCCAGIGTLGRT
jgi:hypothetical protein